MSAYGRPKKLKDERTRYTMYLGESIRRKIDEYVFRVKQSNPDYSRSDFLNEAAEYYLAAIKKGEVRHGKKQD